MAILFIIISVTLQTSLASSSQLIPAFLDAIPFYSSPVSYVVRPELKAVLAVLQKNGVDPLFLQKFEILGKVKRDWPLPPDDEYDLWIKNSRTGVGESPLEISLQAVKIEVLEESDDFFNDDLYVYFFITDGPISTGKVSSLYRGLDQGQA